jgi:hypothetical protein
MNLKRLLFSLMLMATPALGNEYRIYSVQYETDEALGTFTFNSQTYGLITGISYSVFVTTGTSQNQAYEQGHIIFQVPRNTMPNVNSLKGLIIADINSSGARQRMDAKLTAAIAKDARTAQKKTFFSDYVYDPTASTGTFSVEGSTVSLN